MKEKKILYLKVSELRKSRTQIRSDFDEVSLNKLASSIKAFGVINPLIVRINEKSEYEIVSGNRRLEAAVLAGQTVIPCTVQKRDDLSSLILSICENTSFKNLNIFEEAEALYALISKHKLSIEDASLKVGLSPSAFNFKISLLRLNSILRERLLSADLSEDFARLLLRLPEDLRDSLLDKIILEKLSFSNAEKEAERMLDAKKSLFSKVAIKDARLFKNSLNKMVDTMNLSGIKVVSETFETENGIEYRVTIPK